MLKSKNMKEIIKDISAAKKEGTESFCLELEIFNQAERTAENFKKIFEAMGDKPAYITNYRRGNVAEYEQTDDQLTEELLLALDCGGTLFDVRGDLFDVSPDEITYNEAAVQKQIKLIDEIHSRGKEVLMSSHTLRFTPMERVLEIAKAQQKRGADIAKIVTNADTDEELYENFRISLALKKEIDIPVLFLCNGAACRKHRLFAPLLGGPLYLCVQNGVEVISQPSMDEAKKLLKMSNYDLDIN